MKNIKTLFFDYDGTIHNSMHIYLPAFQNAYDYLVENSYRKGKIWTEAEVKPFLGQNPKEMWDEYGHDLPETVKKRASQIITDTLASYDEASPPKLYPQALETLSTLKNRGYTLVFLSNCRLAYMKHHAKRFNLDDLFDSMHCAEMYDYTPKEAILAHLLKHTNKESVIIGDRKHDMHAGKQNGIKTIGCLYGFGTKEELSTADIRIHSIDELLTIFT